MEQFKGKPVHINLPAQSVYDRLSDFSSYEQQLASLSEEQRKMIGDVRFTPDSIIITAAPVGEMTLRMVDRRPPELIRLEAENSPIPLYINIEITPDSGQSCEACAAVSLNLPPMLKPLIGSKLQESADRFGDLIAKLF